MGAARLQGWRNDPAPAGAAIGGSEVVSTRPSGAFRGLLRRKAPASSLDSLPRNGPKQFVCRALEPCIAGTAFVLAGCATSADIQSNQLISSAISAQREAAACNRSIASDARYQYIATFLPLAAPYQATVAQMTNTDTADDAESRTLLAWTQDMQKCRQQVIGYFRQSAPIFLALVLSAWADEDGVLVGVIERRVSWGDAATHLRTIQVRLLSSLTDRAIQVDAQLDRTRQAELSRRVAIFDAITNLAP
jgi:hypothetical protein